MDRILAKGVHLPQLLHILLGRQMASLPVTVCNPPETVPFLNLNTAVILWPAITVTVNKNIKQAAKNLLLILLTDLLISAPP